jgi:glucans biosynthesis protein
MKHAIRWFALAAVMACAGAAAFAAEQKFDFEVLRARARDLAAKPPGPPRGEVPAWLKNLDYDQLRRIEFGGSNSLGFEEKLPFQAQYLHPGFILDKQVHLHELHNGIDRPIKVRRELFNYNHVKVGEIPADMGFAGFRLRQVVAAVEHDPRRVGEMLLQYFGVDERGAGHGASIRA